MIVKKRRIFGYEKQDLAVRAVENIVNPPKNTLIPLGGLTELSGSVAQPGIVKHALKR